MTKKLQIRFVVFSMLALIAMQGLIIFFSAIKSFNKMAANADELIETIYTAYPRYADIDARYFVVTLGENEKVLEIDLSHIVTVKRKGADSYAKTALNSGNTSGFVDTFRYSVFRDHGKITIVFLALGYGENQGVSHKSKPMSDLCVVQGDMPMWFKNGMEAALLAPTAMNQQKFKFILDGNTVEAKSLSGFYSKVDLGIVKYHFEVGAGTENFDWK